MPEAAPGNGSNKSLETALLLEKYEPVAIIGIGMRVPADNNTPAEFAEFLKRGCSRHRADPKRSLGCRRDLFQRIGRKGKKSSKQRRLSVTHR